MKILLKWLHACTYDIHLHTSMKNTNHLQIAAPTISGFLNLWATEEFLTGYGLVLLKLSTFCKINFLMKLMVALELQTS